MISASNDSTIKIWDIKTKKLLKEQKILYSISSCSFTPNGLQIITSSCHGNCDIFDSENINLLFKSKLYNSFFDIEFSLDGRKMLSYISNKYANIPPYIIVKEWIEDDLIKYSAKLS